MPSARCLWWMRQIEDYAWRPEKHIDKMSRAEKLRTFGAYWWEIEEVLKPMLQEPLDTWGVSPIVVSEAGQLSPLSLAWCLASVNRGSGALSIP